MKLLSLNLYFNPMDWYVRKPPNYVTPHRRMFRLMNFIHSQEEEPDILVFQEYWGPMHPECLYFLNKMGYRQTEEKLEVGWIARSLSGLFGHGLATSTLFLDLYLTLSNIYQSFRVSYHSLGGLNIFYRPDRLKVLQQWRYTFPISESKSRKGLQVVLVQQGSGGTSTRYLICNTHLDARNDDNKIKQAKFICQFLKSEVIPAIAPSPAADAAPKILLMGDFNVAFHRKDLYGRLVGVFQEAGLEAHDLYNQKGQNRDIKSYDGDRNALVNHPENSGRLDYIWSIGQSPNFCSSIKIAVQERNQEISDHYPLLATFE